ncbi:Gfo/Idh/MocA family protein [Cohnella fermenti]|uniref:Gfo/Idh/MocA family oxidoreductase n=1 Tax=Cohnella fermenti TaxID=2565925 RepID=A0A4S4BF06_9BACL|nr:Gfo/Idh/MocA family oxidoreductase [Cohnella fermenti]THF72825.1 Gfo/Idh/MocA family oxidoreductase [Cohnella fermenti]
MSKLKVGVVGTGGIFRAVHGPGWSSHPSVDIVAMCDFRREAAEACAREYGVTRVYSDYTDMLEREKLDIVAVCTPNVYHSAVSIAALERGVHVFSEKPDAINPAEARRMAAAAARSGKLLMVMRNNRFMPASQFLKSYIESGQMGDIYTGRAGWIRRRGIPGRGGWFTTRELSGGGPLIDLGVHMIDLAMWLMGDPQPVAVSGAAYTKFAHTTLADSAHSQFGSAVENGTFDVEDLAAGFIRFANGATLQIEFSWASNIVEEMKFLELRGTSAGCSLRGDTLQLATEIEHTLCDIAPRFGSGTGSSHSRNIHHFIECVLGREEPIIRPEHGVDMIEILTAIYESASTGAEVRLDSPDK